MLKGYSVQSAVCTGEGDGAGRKIDRSHNPESGPFSTLLILVLVKNFEEVASGNWYSGKRFRERNVQRK